MAVAFDLSAPAAACRAILRKIGGSVERVASECTIARVGDCLHVTLAARDDFRWRTLQGLSGANRDNG